MPKEASLGLAAGVVAGLLYASVAIGYQGAIVLAYLAQLPLFLAGLGLGVNAVAIAGATGALVVLGASNVTAGTLFILLSAGPAWLIVSRALDSRPGPGGTVDWYPAGRLLAWLTGGGLAMLVAAAGFYAAHEGGMEGTARRTLAEMLNQQALPEGRTGVNVLIDVLSRFLPALIVSSWMMMTTVNGILAQALLSQSGRSLRPTPRLAGLTLPRWVGIALLAAIGAAAVPGQIGTLGMNAAIVLLLPFFFLGLAAIHALSHRWPGRAFILVLLYLVIILAAWPAVVVTAVGVIEQIAGLRRRFAPPDPDRENE